MTGASTAKRLIETALALPVGEQVTTEAVHSHLAKRGYRVSRRTVERDLLSIASLFSIEREGGRPQGYRWCRRVAIEPHTSHARAFTGGTPA